MCDAPTADQESRISRAIEGCEVCHAGCRLIVKGSKTVYSDDGQAESEKATRCDDDTVII